MRRLRSLALAALLLVPIVACNSKAKKEADAASTDLDRIDALVKERFGGAVDRGLPKLASTLAPKISPSSDVHFGAEKLGEAIVEAVGKDAELRVAKRSYLAIVDAGAAITWVDDTGFKVVGRKLDPAFPAVAQSLTSDAPSVRGSGRYGGSGEEALTFVVSTRLRDAQGATVGALALFWESHDAASDLQRQLLTDYAQKSATPIKHIKTKDRLKMAMDQPDLWVALFRPGQLYMEDGAPQQLEDALKTLDLAGKTQNGRWVGLFDVMNTSWGGAAMREPLLGADVGLAVLRHQP